MGWPDEIAKAVLFLASDMADYSSAERISSSNDPAVAARAGGPGDRVTGPPSFCAWRPRVCAAGREHSMKARRWLQVWLVLVIASGCAQRADWIESTLVTVDVTGRWTGELILNRGWVIPH